MEDIKYIAGLLFLMVMIGVSLYAIVAGRKDDKGNSGT